jgi:MFS family permease
VTFAIGALVFALLSVWFGRISDRVGREKFLIIGCALGIIYPLLYASTYNVFQYMGLRFVWAFSAVATGPVFMAYLQDCIKGLKKKGYYFGLLYSAQSILGAGASFLGGFLSDTYGLKAPYFAMAIIFALATIIALFTLKFKARTFGHQEKRDLFFGLRQFFRNPALRFYFMHNTAFSLNWGIKAMLWPLIIYSMIQMDTITGAVFATMGIMAFLLLPFVGKLVDKIGVFPAALLGLVLLGGSGIVLALTGSIALFWGAAVVFATGEALNGPAQAVLLTDNIKSNMRGELLGLDAVFDNTFGTLSPFIAGLLLNILSPQKVLLIYIIIIWVAFLVCSWLYKTQLMRRKNFKYTSNK